MVQSIKEAAAGGQLELIESHRATGNESSYTFNGSWDMDTTYAELIVRFTGRTAASMALEMVLNGVTGTSYRYYKFTQAATTLTGTAAASQPEFQLITSSGGTDYPLVAEAHISSAGADNVFMVTSHGYVVVGFQQIIGGDVGLSGAGTVLTSVKLQASVQNWTEHTQIDLYGVKL